MAEAKPKAPRKSPVTINVIDVSPITDELKLFRLELSRTNMLLELICQANNIATRIEDARPKDLADTSADYGVDAEFGEFVERMQRESGRQLSEDQFRTVFEAYKKLDTEAV